MAASRSKTPSVPSIVYAPGSPLSKIVASLDRIAESLANVLVTGESGAGKEVIVRAMHARSPVRGGPFVPVNCGAIPRELMESEFFGHVRGSFSGALRDRTGRLELANGGTLFLDEVAEMPIDLQVKLLRAIQEKAFEPVGSSDMRSSDFRLIAATNKDLEEAVGAGEFRQDLYFRIDVVRLEIPPLRERPMDIVALAEHFVQEQNRIRGTTVRGFDDEAVAALKAHDWPGNVRELQNVIAGVMVFRDEGVVEAEDVQRHLFRRLSPTHSAALADVIELPADGLDLRAELDRIERALIVKALRRVNGNKAQAANLLRLKRTTLVEKLKRKKLDVA